MKRRDFLKSTILFAAVSSVLGKATGILSNVAHAAGVFAAEKKLGYKAKSTKAGKVCSGCKHFKENAEAGKDAGQCVLPAMVNAMGKPSAVYVSKGGYCNMWAKKA